MDQLFIKVYQKQLNLRSPDEILGSVLCHSPLWSTLNKRPTLEKALSSTKDQDTCRFPLITKLKVHKSVEFFREDFMELALISMENFCDTFEVKRCCFIFSKSKKKIVVEELKTEPKIDFINIPSEAYFSYGRTYLKAYAILYTKINYLERKCEIDLSNWKAFLFNDI